MKNTNKKALNSMSECFCCLEKAQAIINLIIATQELSIDYEVSLNVALKNVKKAQFLTLKVQKAFPESLYGFDQ